MFRARIFRGNSGPAQNIASRLDEPQYFASRLDKTTGFDRHVQFCKRIVSNNDWPTGGDSESVNRFSIIWMSEPLHADACSEKTGKL